MNISSMPMLNDFWRVYKGFQEFKSGTVTTDS